MLFFICINHLYLWHFRLRENRKQPLSVTKALNTVIPRPQSDIVMSNSSNLLPDIMTASCPMHSKCDHRNYDMAMITTYHGGDTKYELFRSENRHQAVNTFRLMDQKPRVIPQPVYRRQVLPDAVDRNVFVNSWLLDGTNPQLKRHFSTLE